MPTPSELSDLLFHADPMGTCCRENDAFDEYDRIAFELAEHMEEGDRSDVALHQVLREWFGDELVERAQLADAIEALETLDRREGGAP
ncbi:hypothetical protein [Halomonas sp.]|uniref:hypothetical protein n=1 Tax=Halomonas sp. TaxID=1486246 RepID=UPI003562CD4D